MALTARYLARALTGAVLVFTMAACSSGDGETDPGSTGAGDVVPIVASTSVWGDIARQIGGDHVSVTSLIGDPSQDPHEFQPTSRDELAVSRAAVVIVNGGGYDDFLPQMVTAANDTATVITATEVAKPALADSGVDPDNEHIWFSLDAAGAVAKVIGATLAERDPAHRNEFDKNVQEFTASLDPVRAQLASIRQQHGGAPIVVTEPLPLYLTTAAGLKNITPEAFSEAMEEGIDVSPTDLADVLGLFSAGPDAGSDASPGADTGSGAVPASAVRLLIVNEQTASAQSDQVQAAAEAAGVPVLALSETLPADLGYQAWMGQVATDLSARLSS